MTEIIERKIYADFDEEGVFVYQAFKPEIVKVAVEKGTFGKGFGLDRITWIKPSFAWILRRSEYASKHRMEAIARIKIPHGAFNEILQHSIETQWNGMSFQSEDDWQKRLNQSDVIHQWDPERDLEGRKLDRQAIQIGLRGEMIKRYVHEFVCKVEDITPLAKQIGLAVKKRQALNMPVPIEKVYPVEDSLFKHLGCI